MGQTGRQTATYLPKSFCPERLQTLRRHDLQGSSTHLQSHLQLMAYSVLISVGLMIEYNRTRKHPYIYIYMTCNLLYDSSSELAWQEGTYLTSPMRALNKYEQTNQPRHQVIRLGEMTEKVMYLLEKFPHAFISGLVKYYVLELHPNFIPLFENGLIKSHICEMGSFD